MEQDLDSALDDLLQGTFDDVEEMDSGRTKEVSEFIPAETVSFICTTAPLSCCIWQHLTAAKKLTVFETFFDVVRSHSLFS